MEAGKARNFKYICMHREDKETKEEGWSRGSSFDRKISELRESGLLLTCGKLR